jgi:uncharacterized protein
MIMISLTKMEIIAEIFIEAFKTLADMAPYLLIGFAAAGVLSVLVSAEKIERHLGGKGLLPVLKAALFGVPLPLCSCGVIPVAASLRRHGSSRGATLSFLLSTPQTGVDSILVTYGLLGPVFAVFRPTVAFITGLIGGALMDRMETDGERDEIKPEPACSESCCAPSGHRNKFTRALHYGFVVLPRDVARPMLIGLAVAGLLGALVPHDFLASHALGRGLPAMLLMMLVGIPLYVCATASVPIGAALIAAGVSPGAALVFLITGPATNTATIATVWTVLGKKATAVYLGTIVMTSLAAGYLLDMLFSMPGIRTPDLAHCTQVSPVGIASAMILLIVLAVAFIRPRGRHNGRTGGCTEILRVEGMTCAHCADSVKTALGECVGVESVAVDLKAGTATVIGHGLSRPALERAVTGLGFKVPGSGPNIEAQAK